MDNNNQFLLAGTIRQLQRYFDTSHIRASDLQELERYVAAQVQQLLLKDLNRLLHILYRIDVEEQQVKKALTSASAAEAAATIAQLIIKRELQKVQTRFKYQQN